MRKRQERACSQNLLQKQQIMQKAVGNSLGEGMIIFLCLIGTLLLTMPDFRAEPIGDILIALGSYVSIFAVMAVYFVGACCRYRVLNRLYAITSPGGQEVHITCKRVKLMPMRVSKYTRRLVCVVFVGAEGEKYYHVLNTPEIMDREIRKRFKQYKHRKMDLTCYKGARILKNDPVSH